MVVFPSRRGITPVFGYTAPHPSGRGTSTLQIKTLPSTQYGALRLPSVPLAALRCLRLAIPPLRRSLLPSASTRGRGLRGVGVPVPEPEIVSGDGRVSQVPRDPSCALALFSDPGGTEHARPSRRVGAAPAFDKTEGSREKLSRLYRTAWALAVYASQ
jgi:hypothetical protein